MKDFFVYIKWLYFFVREKIGRCVGRHMTANQITVGRVLIALCLVLVWVYGDMAVKKFVIKVWALCWFGDWLDGAVADATNTRTDTGKWLDPLADKFQFYIPALLFIHHLTWVPFTILFFLDFYSTLKRGFGKMNTSVAGANWYGKWKTGFQILFFFCSAFAFTSEGEQSVIYFNTGQFALWFSIGLSFFSLFLHQNQIYKNPAGHL